MLESLATILADGGPGEPALGSAAREAFAIHLRVAMDFLYVDAPRFDDVVAADFLPDGDDWKRLRPPFTDALTRARARVAREAGRLTYLRLNHAADITPWAYLDIAHDIANAFGVFLRHVPPEKLDECWRDRIPARAALLRLKTG